MKRYANKSEVMFALQNGATLVAHDTIQWIEQPKRLYGVSGFVRRSLWLNLLTKRIIKRVDREKRPPSTLPFHIYKLCNET